MSQSRFCQESKGNRIFDIWVVNAPINPRNRVKYRFRWVKLNISKPGIGGKQNAFIFAKAIFLSIIFSTVSFGSMWLILVNESSKRITFSTFLNIFLGLDLPLYWWKPFNVQKAHISFFHASIHSRRTNLSYRFFGTFSLIILAIAQKIKYA